MSGDIKKIREPIISVLGHVDHGKTTLLDYIRGSVVASREAGGITQHIGATEVPFYIIEKICGNLLEKLKLKIKIRGFLFIDTPGHQAFTTLRKRGGSVADLVILVVDINEGLMPQSIEAIKILKEYKTPFVVAANKIDLIPGWIKNKKLEDQMPHVQEEFNKKFYSLVSQISEYGFNPELFSRISDFSKQLAIVPISAKTGEGIPELLMILLGLAQQYLLNELTIEINSPGKGTILEIKETKGLGITMDVILYDGVIRMGDQIVVGAKKPIITKVKALLKPAPLDEMRDPRKKFQSVDEVYAASGVKIVAPNINDALPGAPVYVGDSSLIEKIKNEIKDVEIQSEKIGVIIRADTIGSLEAIIKMLNTEGIPIRRATLGKVSKQDIVEALTVKIQDKYLGVVLAFNSEVLPEAENFAIERKIKIFQNNIIYKLLEDYEKWVKTEKENEKKDKISSITSPVKLKILPNCIFRQSKPAICGVEILAGKLTTNCKIMKDGKIVGIIKEIQKNKEPVKEALKGEKVAVAIENAVVGKNIDENDTLLSFLSDEEIKVLCSCELTEDERSLINEISKIKKEK
ncbi:MAG: translation initiation factor IF-2 [Candidatus Altiarchaeota archaeon]